MTVAGARVALKMHRFEAGVGILIAVVLGLWAVAIQLRLASLNVPAACIDHWLTLGPEGRTQCINPMAGWAGLVAGEGGRVFELMRVVPFGVGLLAGVPVIARELETRTAQTAWSLNASRRTWLTRQVVPIGGAILLGVAFAALAASPIASQRAQWGDGGAIYEIGASGLPAIARAFAAFGVGLMLGLLIGRSLPALVLGALLCFAMTVSIGVARDRWFTGQPASPIGEAATGIVTGWAWRTPEGQLVTDDEAMARVPPEIVAADGESIQPEGSLEWLEGHGFKTVSLGLTDETAMGWIPFDVAAYAGLGILSLLLTAVLIKRRRPT